MQKTRRLGARGRSEFKQALERLPILGKISSTLHRDIRIA